MKYAGNPGAAAHKAGVNIGISVIVSHRQAEQQQRTAQKAFSQRLALQQPLQGVFRSLDPEAGIGPDVMHRQLAVAGGNQMGRRIVHRTLAGQHPAGEEIIEAAKAPLLEIIHADVVFTDKRPHRQGGNAPIQQPSRRLADTGADHQPYQQPSGSGAVHPLQEAILAVVSGDEVSRSIPPDHPGHRSSRISRGASTAAPMAINFHSTGFFTLKSRMYRNPNSTVAARSTHRPHLPGTSR